MVFNCKILPFALLALSVILFQEVIAGDHDQVRIHTIHHHHVQKYPVYKKIEVPVIKQTKVPFKVHVPFKAPYPVVIKPYIVKIPVHHYPVHSSEHQHHDDHQSHHNDHQSHYDEHQQYDEPQQYYQPQGYQHTESHVHDKW